MFCMNVCVCMSCVLCEQVVLQVREKDTVQSHPHNNSPHLLYITLHTQAWTQIGTYKHTRVYRCTHIHTDTRCVCGHDTYAHKHWQVVHEPLHTAKTHADTQVRLCAHTSIPTAHGHMCTCISIDIQSHINTHYKQRTYVHGWRRLQCLLLLPLVSHCL